MIDCSLRLFGIRGLECVSCYEFSFLHLLSFVAGILLITVYVFTAKFKHCFFGEITVYYFIHAV